MPKDYAKKITKSEPSSINRVYYFFLFFFLIGIFGLFLFNKLNKSDTLKTHVNAVKYFSFLHRSASSVAKPEDIHFDFYPTKVAENKFIGEKTKSQDEPVINQYVLQVAEFNTENQASVERVSLLFANIDANIATRDTPKGKVYSLEVGMFSAYPNAVAEAQKLKQKGISCTIKRIV